MGNAVKVESFEALKNFKVTLCKFAELCNTALGDAENEMQRTQVWLENEQTVYWQGQIRKRTELVSRCKEALRQKTLFKDSSGRTPTAVEEEKALRRATAALQEAEQKLIAVKRYIGKLQKEISVYKGTVQRFATSVAVDLPGAASKLENLMATLQQYVDLAPSVEEVAPPTVTESGPDSVKSEAEEK